MSHHHWPLNTMTQSGAPAAWTTLYQFGGAPALSASGASAYSSVSRHPDGTLHHAMLAAHRSGTA